MAESKGLQIENGKLIGPGTCKDKDIVVPDGVKVIGGFAFGKSRLRSVVIPDSVEKVSGGAFNACRNLKSAIVGDRVKEIGGAVFYGCVNMQTVVLPKSLKVLGELVGQMVFEWCTSLKNLTYKGTKSEWAAIKKRNRSSIYAPGILIVHCTDGDVNY